MCGATALSIAVHPEGHGEGWEWMREQQRLRASGQKVPLLAESLPSSSRVCQRIEIHDPDRLPSTALYADSMNDPSKK